MAAAMDDTVAHEEYDSGSGSGDDGNDNDNEDVDDDLDVVVDDAAGGEEDSTGLKRRIARGTGEQQG